MMETPIAKRMSLRFLSLLLLAAALVADEDLYAILGVRTDAPRFVQQIAEPHVFEHDPAAVEVARHGMHVMSSSGRSGEGTSQVRAQANEPPRDKGK